MVLIATTTSTDNSGLTEYLLPEAEKDTGFDYRIIAAPSWGNTGSAAERLWGLDDARGLAPVGGFEADRRIEPRIGYGLAVFGGRFTGTPEAGLGLSDGNRDYRLGWRLAPADGGTGPFASSGISLEAVREVPYRGATKNRFGAALEARF